ncbi:MAG TPA: ergothioneine biosynthesis protein EgtB [Cyclobacteriaceae bacterium]|nr:ergothioneine biosynthesis protein EgtB [Cyclobacteriaceae bacterium]
MTFENFIDTRKYTERLCERLETEDFVVQAVEEVSPAKWHLAHTTWFFETFLLKPHLSTYREFHPRYSYLFNSYYNAVGSRTHRFHRGLMTRPPVAEVMAYREYVNQEMGILLSKRMTEEVTLLLELGINHEQQHQELLITDLKYNLSLNPLHPEVLDIAEYPKRGETGWESIDEGIYEVGHQGKKFSYDNEHGRHKVFLEAFNISRALVTNGEFEEFIRAGGYQNVDLWHSDGWEWVTKNELKRPLYWQESGQGFKYYTLEGMKVVDPGAPVAHVSFYEAAAYAEWVGCRLPTEFQWEVASSRFDWGQRWEWTNSAYLPYPRYQKAPGAIGEYNGKFMINQMVLRGASVATPDGHSRHTYRNFFPPQSAWQFSGIRLVK